MATDCNFFAYNNEYFYSKMMVDCKIIIIFATDINLMRIKLTGIAT